MTLQAESIRKPFLTIRPSKGWSPINLRDTWMFRDLMMSLAGRDLKLRYKQTALGVLWVVFQPLMQAGILTFVFGFIAKMPAGKTGYFTMAFAGSLGWNAFNNALGKTSGCLLQNSQLVSKVYFPRLVLPLSNIFSTAVDFLIALALMFVIMAVYHVHPTWTLVLIPVWFAFFMLLAMGFGLYAAAMSVTYRDVQYILPVLTQLLMYASPVAYQVPQSLRKYMVFNPLTGLLELLRWSLLREGTFHWQSAAYTAPFAIVCFLCGAAAFRRMERKFADVI